MALREAEIKKLVELVENSEIEEIEIRHWWTKIRITRRCTAHMPSAVTHLPSVAPGPHIVAPPKPVSDSTSGEETQIPEDLYEIRSPMVGTFYRSPTPDAEPFVKEGDAVTAGQVLCIIEAMKVMNQIEADVSGHITRVLVENAKPVEYNQALFLVKLA